MATIATASKGPYSPVTAIEGMFNGSVTRIAYVFKDPGKYGPSTKAVLGETSKRFQDALDDCEIQILDAKWHLEHQLAVNRARREAKAQEEDATAMKRKLDDMKDAAMASGEPEVDEKPAKRQKVEDASGEPMKIEELPNAQLNAGPSIKTKPHVASVPKSDEATVATEATENAKSIPTKPQVTIPQAPDLGTEQTRPSTSEGILKSTSQDTPANEVSNFVSMFGDPSGELGDSGGDDLDFDLDLNSDSFGANMNLEDPSSLNSLLPALESYAIQASDDSGLNFSNDTTNTATDAHAGLGGDFNDWDALLNDSNAGGDEMMNDMEEFDSFFN
jgi:hypothetical protein